MSTLTPDNPDLRRVLTGRMMLGEAFLLKTPMCIPYYACVKSWLELGVRAGLVHSWPNLGKSCATRWALRVLQSKYGTFPWFRVPMREQTRADEGDFFRFLLRSADHDFPTEGRRGDLRDRFSDYLITQGKASPTSLVVIFVDEAQLLTETHWQWLVNIGNEVEPSVRVFWLLVGQHELRTRKTSLQVQGLLQIVNRLLLDEFRFPSVCSQSDCAQVLSGYDQARYPDEKGAFFVDYFAPRLRASGFRLASLAPMLWAEWKEIYEKSGYKGPMILPMTNIARAVSWVLNRLHERDGSKQVELSTLATTAAKRSNYNAALATFPATEASS